MFRILGYPVASMFSTSNVVAAELESIKTEMTEEDTECTGAHISCIFSNSSVGRHHMFWKRLQLPLPQAFQGL